MESSFILSGIDFFLGYIIIGGRTYPEAETHERIVCVFLFLQKLLHTHFYAPALYYFAWLVDYTNACFMTIENEHWFCNQI